MYWPFSAIPSQTHPNFQFHAPDVGGTHPFLRARWGQRPDHGTLGQPVGSPSAKKTRLVLYVLWSKHLKKHVVWCCMVFDSSMGIQIQTSQGLFLSMTIPYFGGRSSQPPGRCFRWWVSSKQGVSQFSCFQLKDRIILAVKIMAFATFFLLTAGHGWILSDATVFQVLK